MEVVLAVVAGVAIAGMVAIALSALVQLRQVRSDPQHSTRPAPEPASPPSRIAPHVMIFPDYVDEQLLDEVAQQLDINIEAIGLTLGSASRRSSGISNSVETGVGFGPVNASGSSTESESAAEEKSAAISSQVRPNFRAKIRAVLDALEARDELLTDLKILPEEVIPEATFVQAGLVVKLEWEMAGIDPGDGTDDDIRPEVLRDLLAVEHVAKEQIQEALRVRFKDIAGEQHGRFSLIASRWHVHVEDGSPVLGISQFDTGPLVPQAFPELDDIPAPHHEIWVPTPKGNLTSHGEQRMLGNNFVQAVVFGRIDHFDSEREALVILPIAVYSEQVPAAAASVEHESH